MLGLQCGVGVMSISPAPLGEVVTCLGGLPNMCISTAGRMLCGEASTDCSVLMKRVVVQASVPRVASCAPDSQAHRFYVMCDLCVWRGEREATLPCKSVLFTITCGYQIQKDVGRGRRSVSGLSFEEMNLKSRHTDTYILHIHIHIHVNTLCLR